MRLELGTPVHCKDGRFGELADVVIDPLKRRVTHFVVQPRHTHALARLVPVELAARDGNGSREVISLRCSVEDVRRLTFVQEVDYLRLGEFPASDPDWDIGVQDVLSLPFYGYDALGVSAGGGDMHVSISYDRVPKGEVEIRRASAVTSADGQHLGQVDGLLVDDDDRITHVVLERGHLWGLREITIPISAVERVQTDSVTLRISKDAVAKLPSVSVHRWRGARDGRETQIGSERP